MKRSGFSWYFQVILIIAILVVLKETGGAAAPAAVESQAALTLSAELPTLPVYDVETLFLAFNGLDNEQSACNYYKAIKAVSDCQLNDPNNPNDNILVGAISFDEWKARNGLAVNPDVDGNGSQFDLVDQLINFILRQEVSALYLNAADLNLARAMHGRRDQDTVAYYVCNYDTIEDARLNRGLKACVAMDYSVIPGVNSDQPFIKFYVFEPTGLSLSAELDSQKRKFIPGLCKACHGSDKQARLAFEPSLGPDLGSHFLPFDLDNFEFLDRPRFTRNAQEVAFRMLNQFIYHSQPAPVVEQLLDGWYPGGTGKQQSNFVPPGWVGHERLYLNVVKPSCRVCHAAVTEFYNWNRFENAPADDPATPLREDQGGFKNLADLIKDRVCRPNTPGVTTFEMPNAEVTFTRFWLSEGLPDPHDQPKILREFFQEVMLMDTTCPAPPLLP
jgi:hypothetical protein